VRLGWSKNCAGMSWRKTNRIKALNKNRKMLKKKGSFMRVIRNEGGSLTKKSELARFMGPKDSKASGKNGNWKKFQRTCLLSSVTVTSLVAQRPSFHGVTVRPSGRLPSALRGLVVPWLRDIRLWKVIILLILLLLLFSVLWYWEW